MLLNDRPGHIGDNDKFATKLPNGSWKCGTCVINDLRKRMYRVLGPDNPKAKEFVQESQREVNK